MVQKQTHPTSTKPDGLPLLPRSGARSSARLCENLALSGELTRPELLLCVNGKDARIQRQNIKFAFGILGKA